MCIVDNVDNDSDDDVEKGIKLDEGEEKVDRGAYTKKGREVVRTIPTAVKVRAGRPDASKVRLSLKCQVGPIPAGSWYKRHWGSIPSAAPNSYEHEVD